MEKELENYEDQDKKSKTHLDGYFSTLKRLFFGFNHSVADMSQSDSEGKNQRLHVDPALQVSC